MKDPVVFSLDAVVAAASAGGEPDLWSDDLGGQASRLGLETLLAAVNGEAGLPPEGARPVFDLLAGQMATRASLAADRRGLPQVRAQRIERPIIVVGMARSGTTLLHALLSLDPANRAPRMWEACFPSPPPSAAAVDDLRRARGDEIVRSNLATYPGLLTAHPYWDALGEATVECEDFCQYAFWSVYYGGFLHIPSYTDWYYSADAAPMYRFHRSFLQQLQYGGPSRRWVLKGTAHSSFLDELHKAYPDAILVWPHRDPTEQVVSTMELECVIRWATDDVGRRRTRDDVLHQVDLALGRAVRSPLLDDPSVIHHVASRDVVDDPVAVVRRIYETHGLDYGHVFETAMRDWLADPANRSDRHGRFHYDAASFGLAESDVTERYDFYAERVRELGVHV